jgi:hypothetical protein
MILKLRDVARPHIKFLVGDGTDIFLWHDNWHPGGPLLLKYGLRLRAIYDAASSVNVRLSSVICQKS